MRLSAAVVLSFLLLLLLVPDAFLWSDSEHPCDYEKLGYDVKCSTIITEIYKLKEDHRTGEHYDYSGQYMTNSLFISATSFISVDPDERIKSNYVTVQPAPPSAALGSSKNSLLTARLHFNTTMSEARKYMAKVTDIVMYISSHHAESYDPIDFPYQESYLQLKNNGTILKDPYYKSGTFFIPAIFLSADEEVTRNQEARKRLVFPSHKGPWTQKQLWEYMDTYPWTHGDTKFWFSNPGIYRINLVTGKISELYYDPSTPGVNFLT